MYRNAQHAKVAQAQVELGRKVGAGLVAGCLAVSMLPAVAFAMPGQGNGPSQAQDNQQPPQMSQNWQGAPDNGQQPYESGQVAQGEQFDAPGQDGLCGEPGQYARGGQPDQAPAQLGQPVQQLRTDQPERGDSVSNGDENGAQQGMPSAQAPDGGEQHSAPGDLGSSGNPSDMPDGSDLDARIIAAIPDDDIRARAEAGNPDTENLRPAIPEGEVNIQQIIDTIRQAVMAAEQFGTGAPGQVSTRTADRQFAQAPNDIAAPGDSASAVAAQAPVDTASAPTGTAPSSMEASGNAAPAEGVNAPASVSDDQTQRPGVGNAAPAADDTSALALFQKIIDAIKGALGL